MYEAKCICGECVVTAKGFPKWAANCHCSQCRRHVSTNYASLCGYNVEDIKLAKGETFSYSTGREERHMCKKCGTKVFVDLHHLKQRAIYLDNFTKPNHGPDGKLHHAFKPTIHIFYTSGIVNVIDGLPKFTQLPGAFGGNDQKVDEHYHK